VGRTMQIGPKWKDNLIPVSWDIVKDFPEYMTWE
jgi:hypothetical protein